LAFVIAKAFFMPKIFDKKFDRYIPAEDIDSRIKILSESISEDYQDLNPLFIVVLNGAFIFAADLLRALDIDAEMSFIKVKSYEGLNSSGKMLSVIGLNEDIEGRDVIILDDIIDTGHTMDMLISQFQNLKASSIKTCCLLFKKQAFKANFTVDYFGFEIEDRFVVGYGLDYDGKGRQFKDIYALAD
jgi:hypoxanthine phosphoribosyltransferase